MLFFFSHAFFTSRSHLIYKSQHTAFYLNRAESKRVRKKKWKTENGSQYVLLVLNNDFCLVTPFTESGFHFLSLSFLSAFFRRFLASRISYFRFFSEFNLNIISWMLQCETREISPMHSTENDF